MQKFTDSVAVSGTKLTSEGFLIADAYAVRTGVQQYLGSEVGRPDLAMVNVYRPEEEVFAKDTLQSFSHVPVTNDHPTVAVDSTNWKQLAVGETSTDILRDGQKMKIPLILKDQSVIDAVQAGKRQLSAGYACELVWEDGIAPDGTPYQAKQTQIRANHVAVVRNGRAGSEFRIGDAEPVSWGAAPFQDKETRPMLKTIMFDGISIEVTDAAAQAIAKLEGQIGTLKAQVTDAQAAVTKVTTDKDIEIGTLKAQLADAQNLVPDAITLDKLAADRQVLIDSAKKIAPKLEVKGLSDADIRKAAVAAKYGDDFVKDASPEVISGMFLTATKDAATATNVDPVLGTRVVHQDNATTLADHGQSVYEQGLKERWKTAGVA